VRAWAGIVAALVLTVAALRSLAAPPAGDVIDLGDGLAAEFLGAGEATSPTGAHSKALYVNVALSDAGVLAVPEKLIEAADRLFETILLEAAHTGGYRHAIVNIRRATGDFEDFHYARGEDAVWLRRAGAAPWKVAQDPAWTPPEMDEVDLGALGRIQIEYAGEAAAPAGFKRAFAVDVVTATPNSNVERKYRELRALWAVMDQARLRTDGFDSVMFSSFSEPPRGRFHMRLVFELTVGRRENGPWPPMPEAMPPMEGPPVLTSEVRVPVERLTAMIRGAFAGVMPGADFAGALAVQIPEGGVLVAHGAAARVSPARVTLGQDYFGATRRPRR
jgi:hypothetical protein